MCVCSVVSDHLRPHGLASLFMEFSRQEYWSRLSFPPQGDFPNPELELAFLLPCA